MIDCSQVTGKTRNKEYASQAWKSMYLTSVCTSFSESISASARDPIMTLSPGRLSAAASGIPVCYCGTAENNILNPS